jgi:tetratricopeptide (TPR) repeat protein
LIVACLQEALAHHQAGRLDEAEGLYQRVLAIEPLQPDAVHLLGMAALARGRLDDALRLLRQATQLKPNEAVFVSDLGVVHEARGNFREAESGYRRALQLNPGHAESLNNLGNMHRAAWRLSEAVECYQAALAAKPDFALAHMNLGNAFGDQQRLEEAVACNHRALEIDDRFLDARKNLVIALSNQGHYEKARLELGRARAIAPADPGLKIREALLLPVIPESVSAIDERRKGLEAAVDQLLGDELSIRDPVTETPGQAFYLTYHGRNDLEISRKIAALYRRAVPGLDFTAPHCHPQRSRGSSRLRVGMISRFFYRHSVSVHYGGLMRVFPREQARYTLMRVAGPEDDVPRALEATADKVVRLSTRLSEAREQVAAEEFRSPTFLPSRGWLPCSA